MPGLKGEQVRRADLCPLLHHSRLNVRSGENRLEIAASPQMAVVGRSFRARGSIPGWIRGLARAHFSETRFQNFPSNDTNLKRTFCVKLPIDFLGHLFLGSPTLKQ